MNTENKPIYESAKHLNYLKQELIELLNEMIVTVNEAENILEIKHFTIQKTSYDLDFKVTDKITNNYCFHRSLKKCLIYIMKQLLKNKQ